MAKLRADFNGLFGDVLCLSHDDTCLNEDDSVIQLRPGMKAVAFDEDLDDNGERVNLIASGTIEVAPDWLQCNGSKWVLKIDADGVRHETDLHKEAEGVVGP